RLDAALAVPDRRNALESLEEIAAAPPGGPAALAACAGRRYESANADERWLLRHLLGLLPEAGGPVVLDLLARVPSADLLSLAVRRRLAVPAPVLDGLVERLGCTELVVDALGLSGDPGRAEVLGGLLDEEKVRGRAALALARLGAREWTVPIARRLSETTGLAHAAFAVALEEMGDTAAVPYLLDWLARSPGPPAGDVHLALARLTGRDPLIPTSATVQEYSAHVRRVWADLDLTAPPAPRMCRVTAEAPGRLRFSLDEGRGRIRVDYDPPSPGSPWPRWNKTLHVGGRALYRVSSGCGTCETMMGLLGFPPPEAKTEAARVRGALANPRGLTAATADALEPLITELASGDYRAHLVDLPLERVDAPERSWWLRRAAVRADPERRRPDPVDWPGTGHFQTPRMSPGPPPTYGSVLPSQPLDRLDPATVRRHASAIARGERPAALLLAWAEHRCVEAEWEERFLIGVILDGHHRLAAYAAAGVPARLLVLTRTESGGTFE